MNLYEFFYHKKQETGLTVSAMADSIGCTHSYLSQIILGRRTPGFKIAIKIEKYSGGLVSMDEMANPVCVPVTQKKSVAQSR